MVKIKVNKNDDFIKSVNITGHTMFDDYGKDIVCASVSSIVITTVNAILRIDSNSITYNEDPFCIEVVSFNEVVNELLENMVSLLKELEQDYPKNIRFL